MKFLLELKKIILSHLMTSRQPHKIVQILMGHPLFLEENVNFYFKVESVSKGR